jgi:hypothetical protein
LGGFIARYQRPQSSSASRFTAGAFGFLTLSQSAVFDLIRQKRHGDDAVLIAFDLIALIGGGFIAAIINAFIGAVILLIVLRLVSRAA